MSRRNFLFVSLDGLIGDVAWRVQEHGNGVRYAITDDRYSQDVADGFVEKTDDWRGDLDWADVVVFDDTYGLGACADEVRDRGIPVIGGTPATDRLESHRGYGHETMAELGIDVLDCTVCSTVDEAVAHVEDAPGRYVIKPSGPSPAAQDLVFVGEAEDGADAIQMLERYRRVLGSDSEIQLQPRVDGVEISICGFFDGESFVEPYNYTFEHKRLYPGQLGPNTGEMGTSMFWDGPTVLSRRTVERFEGFLADEGYVGPFDINCIVNGDGIHPLEITPRFGYPQIAIQEEALETPIDRVLYGLATGDLDGFDVHDGFQVGYRVCVPPFPADDQRWFDDHSRDAVVRFRTDGVPEGVHLEDVKRTDGAYRVAGATGEVLVVTGTGRTMPGAQAEAYGRADQIVLPNKFYRNDIGDTWSQDRRKLGRWGYLEPPEKPAMARPDGGATDRTPS